MSDNRIKGAVSFMALGGVFVVSGIHSFRRKRRVADVASSRSATAAQGLVELEGFAWHSGSLVKNLNGHDCCLRHIKLQHYVKRHKSSSWETIWENRNSDHFYLVDKLGSVKIFTHDTNYDAVETTMRWQSVPSRYQEEILNLGSFKSTLGGLVGFPPSGWFGGSYRILENSIPVGCPVYCQGSFSTPLNLNKTVTIPGIATFFNMIQKQAKQPIHTMMSLDKNRDGRVCESEATTAFVVAGQVALRKSASNENMGSAPLHGLVQSTQEHPLIISGRHQHYLLKKLGYWYMLQVVGGAAMIAAGFAFLFT
jgi:hypothetical protein